MPEAQALTKLRHDIDRRPHRLKAVLVEDSLRKSFLKGAPAQEGKVVKAFCAHNASSALKTRPKVSSFLGTGACAYTIGNTGTGTVILLEMT